MVVSESSSKRSANLVRAFTAKLRRACLSAPLAAALVFAAPLAHAAPVACEAMAGREGPPSSIALPTKGFRINAATSIAAVTTIAAPAPAPVATGGPGGGAGAGGGAPRPSGPTLPHPAYCRIEGSILPVDPSAPTIDFAVAVPDAWNGSMWHVGGGGNNGSIPDLTNAGGAGTPIPTGAPSLLAQGFAVYGSDSGHQGQATDWVRNQEAWLNFSYAQLKKTHDAALSVLVTMQGKTPQRSYFAGGSQGGREALEVVARYGADYDGVISMVPLAYFQGLLTDPTIKMIAQAQPGAWIPPSKHALVRAAVQKTCDARDGLEDGVIGDYAGCFASLDPALSPNALSYLRCASGNDQGDSCLSAAQLAMFNSLHASVKYPYPLPNGFSDWPGWAGGGETGLLARTQPKLDDPASGQFGIGAPMQRVLFGDGPAYNLFKFDLTSNRARIERLSRELDVPADFSTFIRNGGKLIWVTGASDTVTNPRAQMRLYDQVVKRNGRAAVDGAVRYYVLPSGDHGRTSRTLSGQAMPSSWNVAGALRDWVENGVAPPDAPLLAAYNGDVITATRPMCRYPAYPHYVAGSPNWASAFSCRGR
jgi:feruloyl esterase